MLGMMDGFDNIFVVTGEVKKAPTLTRRTEFRQDVLTCQRDKIVRWVDLETRPDVTKNPRRVVLEFEIVLCRWS